MYNFSSFQILLLLSTILISLAEDCGKDGQPPCTINFSIPASYFNQTSNDSLNNFQIFQSPVSFNLYFDGKNHSKPGWPLIEALTPTQKPKKRKFQAQEASEDVPSPSEDGSDEMSRENEKAPGNFMEMYGQLMMLLEANKGIKHKIDNLRKQMTEGSGPLPRSHSNSVVRKRFVGSYNDTEQEKGKPLRMQRTNDGNRTKQQRVHSKKIQY